MTTSGTEQLELFKLEECRLPYDVCRCRNHACPFKMGCARYRCQGNPYGQSYSCFQPKLDGCAHAIPYSEYQITHVS